MQREMFALALQLQLSIKAYSYTKYKYLYSKARKHKCLVWVRDLWRRDIYNIYQVHDTRYLRKAPGISTAAAAAAAAVVRELELERCCCCCFVDFRAAASSVKRGGIYLVFCEACRTYHSGTMTRTESTSSIRYHGTDQITTKYYEVLRKYYEVLRLIFLPKGRRYLSYLLLTRDSWLLNRRS